MAEWSKALVLGTSPKGRGFESRRCQYIVFNDLKAIHEGVNMPMCDFRYPIKFLEPFSVSDSDFRDFSVSDSDFRDFSVSVSDFRDFSVSDSDFCVSDTKN